jgi:S1-C subfamily serine protease
VEKNGPADKAHLQRGFLVTGIEGQSVSDFKSVGEIVCSKKPGDSLQVAVIAPRRLGAGYVEFRQGTVALNVR